MQKSFGATLIASTAGVGVKKAPSSQQAAEFGQVYDHAPLRSALVRQTVKEELFLPQALSASPKPLDYYLSRILDALG